MNPMRLSVLLAAIFTSGILSAHPLLESSSDVSVDASSAHLSARLLANVTITTTPTGLRISVDGTPYTAPQAFTWGTGTQHTISVSSPQSSAGTRHVFSSWSDGGSQTHSITVGSSDMTYTANFSTQYLLISASTPLEGGTISKVPSSADGYYASGTLVQLTAVPATGYVFTTWSNDLTGSANPQTITVSAPRSVMATFVKASDVTIATNPVGLQISVDGTPYTAPQTFSVGIGTQHTISVPSPQTSGGTRHVFSSWSDGGALTHSITVGSSSATYTANFTIQYLLSTSASPSEAGSIGEIPSSADGFYASGTSVQLTAYPASGYVFTAWTNDLSGSANPQTIIMTVPRSVTATFTMISAIDGPTVGHPATFNLSPVYPNPFNASTTIQYEIPVRGPASLKIYSMQGQELSTLVGGESPEGIYKVTWNAADLPSGIYLCRLASGGLSTTRKLILLK